MLSAGLRANGDKTATEDKKKRKLKSPNQLMALESFYSEHMYPSEEMKAKLAVEIGLTEKQVSGWFCHRRTKDKRLPKDQGNNIGSQDRSSVVLQDRGSGHHRQDSCGSTKQTDYMNPKAREVESQRLYRGSYQIGNVDGADTTSSESSSSLHCHHLVSSKNGVLDVENPRYVSRNTVITPLHPQVTGSFGHNKPSGYLKVKGQTEKAVITAVKRQLGRHYQEDGPPLGVHFDPLPPGAFESPTKDIVQEPIYVGNKRPHSPYVTGVKRNSNPGPSYGYFTKPSNLAPWSGGRSPDLMEKGPSTGMGEKYYGERNHLKMHREKLHSMDEPPVVKRVKQDYLQ